MIGKTYLDYAATTPVDARVIEAMMPYFQQVFGNPSSVHFAGQQAEAGLDEARGQVAMNLKARPPEIVFTACGTESDNLALRGVCWAQRRRSGRKHILTSPVEHHAVLHTAYQLAELFDFDLELLPVDSFGRIPPEAVANAIRKDTAIVSVIYANNEIGTINPIADIGAICREKEVPFHSDAVQAAAHIQMDVEADHLDLLSIGAHKFYGPKGVGALYVREGTPILPTQTGGKQELGLRAGTQNIPYILGLAEALRLAQTGVKERQKHFLPLRDHIIGQVLEEIPQSRLTGHPSERLPNHASFVFEGVDGNLLLMMLDAAGFACSSGSACKTGNPQPSDVLLAIGLSPAWALGSLRVTLGSATTSNDVDAFLKALPAIVEKARKLS